MIDQLLLPAGNPLFLISLLHLDKGHHRIAVFGSLVHHFGILQGLVSRGIGKPGHRHHQNFHVPNISLLREIMCDKDPLLQN